MNWFLPLLLLIAFTPISSGVDLEISNYFYEEGHFGSCPYSRFICRHDELPGFALGGGAAVLLALGYAVPYLMRWRRACTAIVFAFLLGPGLIIFFGFKEHWGRPAPFQISEFGGTQAFRPFYSPAFSWDEDDYKSFPSGHASMGAIYLCLYLVGVRERSRVLAWAGLLFSGVLISALSYAQIVAGGHFFSDIFVSIILIWWVSLASCWIAYRAT